MKLGFGIPVIGPAVSSAAGLSAFCAGLEDLGYDSLWAADRLVTPVAPQTPYPGKEQPFPPQMTRNLDPVLLWTVAATATSRVRLDAVVCTAGMGTVQAALAAGVPMVLRPVLADQPWNAQRVASAGAGLVAADPAEAGSAVRAVLTEPRYRAAAQAAAAAIRSMPAPEAALASLLVKAGLSTQVR